MSELETVKSLAAGVVRLDTGVGAGDGKVVEGDVVGAGKLEGEGAVIGIAAVEEGGARACGRSDDRHAAVGW